MPLNTIHWTTNHNNRFRSFSNNNITSISSTDFPVNTLITWLYVNDAACIRMWNACTSDLTANPITLLPSRVFQNLPNLVNLYWNYHYQILGMLIYSLDTQSIQSWVTLHLTHSMEPRMWICLLFLIIVNDNNVPNIFKAGLWQYFPPSITIIILIFALSLQLRAWKFLLLAKSMWW